MNPQDRQFLEDNRLFVESYRQENIPRYMSLRDRQRLESIVQTYFDPGFSTDHYCPECVRAFIPNAYLLYDEYLKKQQANEPTEQSVSGPTPERIRRSHKSTNGPKG